MGQPTRPRLSDERGDDTAPPWQTPWPHPPAHPFIKWTADNAHGRVGLDCARCNSFLYVNASHAKCVISVMDDVKKKKRIYCIYIHTHKQTHIQMLLNRKLLTEIYQSYKFATLICFCFFYPRMTHDSGTSWHQI